MERPDRIIGPHGGYRKLRSFQTAQIVYDATVVRGRYKSDGSDRSGASDKSDPYSFRTAGAEQAANTLICLIHQTSFLLGRQMQKLEQSFMREGGFTERLYQARVKNRTRQAGRTSQT